MSKEETTRERDEKLVDAIGRSAMLGYDAGAKDKEEFAKEVAIGFAEWLHPDEDGNHWQMYDGHDRWINIKTNEVLETKQLYQQYLKSK